MTDRRQLTVILQPDEDRAFQAFMDSQLVPTTRSRAAAYLLRAGLKARGFPARVPEQEAGSDDGK